MCCCCCCCCCCRALLCCVVVGVGRVWSAREVRLSSSCQYHAPSKGLFSLCWNLIFHGCQSTVFIVFQGTYLTDKVLSPLKSRAKTYKNFLMMTATVSNYFVDVKDYNAKTMWSLCAKWNSWNTLKVYIQVYRFFIHLIVWRHGRCGQIAKEYKFKETNIITLRREKIFLGMGAFSRKWIS